MLMKDISAETQQVALPVPDEAAFLENRLQWIVVHAENALQREALMHLVAAVVNRHADSEAR